MPTSQAPTLRERIRMLDQESQLVDLAEHPELRDDFVPKERQGEEPCQGSRSTVEVQAHAATCRVCGASWSELERYLWARLATHPIRLGEDGQPLPGTKAAELTRARAGSLARRSKPD